MKKTISILVCITMFFAVCGFVTATDEDAWKENTGEINVEKMTVSGNGVEIVGNTVFITMGGDFVVSGKNDNIMIHVNSTDKVKLRLDNAVMTNPTGPVIFFENAKKAFITVSKGSVNCLVDGSEYNVDAKAAVFSNDDLEIKGEGALYVTSLSHHAIASDDDLKIEEGTIGLAAMKKDGIHANNTVEITGGNICIVAEGDGIQAEEDVVIKNGVVDITTTGEVDTKTNNREFFGRGEKTGGNMPRNDRENRMNEIAHMGEGTANEGMPMPPDGMARPDGGTMAPDGMARPDGDTMPPDGMARPDGGTVPPEMPGDFTPPNGEMPSAENETLITQEDETAATKGIKGETNVDITGGTVVIKSNDHGIHSADKLSVTGGSITITSQYGKGISAHGETVIGGGVINITKSTEGIESKGNLTITAGSINVTASDDGINAGGTGGRDAVNRQDKNAPTGHDLTITGGSVFVNAQGDGLDANGKITITGGNIVVEGPVNNGNGALDSGGVIKVDGGELLALGASGMAESPDSDSLQPSFKLVVDKTIEKGTTIMITNSENQLLCSYTTIKQGNSVVYSSPQLKVGEEYAVTIGSDVHKINMTSNATTSGNGGFGSFGGRRW